MKTIAPGVRRLATSWQVFANVRGRFYSKTYPLDTPLEKLKKQRAALIAEATYAKPAPLRERQATFAEDAQRYLPLVAKMPSIQDRTHHINAWVAQFGPRARASITSFEIRAVLEQWRHNGRQDGQGLSLGALNRRRTALMSLYTVLDGKSQPNVVKDVPDYDEPDIKARDVPMRTISRVLRTFGVDTQTRARLRVLQWTGWPAKLVQQLTPEDVDAKRGRVHVAARDKAKGYPAGWVPVMPRALAAIRYLFRVGAEGDFSTSSMHSRLADHCEAMGIEPFNPYTLRHTFGTWAAARVKDNDALRDLLRTRSIDRYIEGARAARMEAARAALMRR